MKTIEQVETMINATGSCGGLFCDCKEVCKKRIEILTEWKAEIEKEVGLQIRKWYNIPLTKAEMEWET